MTRLLTILLFFTACSADPDEEEPIVERPPAATHPCAPPPGVSGSPHSIEEAVALINALPKPTGIACLIQSLDRPLRVAATFSVLSAQPASGERSPRIFFFSGPLIVSVVPEGTGEDLVEFSVLGTDGRSRKGELVFPVEAPVSPEAPYRNIMFSETLTTCGLCHADEQPDAEMGAAMTFTSVALRPVDSMVLPLEKVRAEANACDLEKEPKRCSMLQAVFAGEVKEERFPSELPTFWD